MSVIEDVQFYFFASDSSTSCRCLVRVAFRDCTARQCLPLRRKFIECSIINPALSLLMKHLVIGQHQKTPNFSAFHRSPHGSLVSIGQYFVPRG